MQEEPLFDTTDKNAENVMKEEIRNFRTDKGESRREIKRTRHRIGSSLTN